MISFKWHDIESHTQQTCTWRGKTATIKSSNVAHLNAMTELKIKTVRWSERARKIEIESNRVDKAGEMNGGAKHKLIGCLTVELFKLTIHFDESFIKWRNLMRLTLLLLNSSTLACFVFFSRWNGLVFSVGVSCDRYMRK